MSEGRDPHETEMQQLLREYLAPLRGRTYQELCDLAKEKGILLHEAQDRSGRGYGIEVSVHFNKRDGEIRVLGTIDPIPAKRLLGVLPLLVGGVTDGFFMSPRGTIS